MLKGKEIILGVTGGIACYKAVELLRELTKAGAAVQVVMTKNASQFVQPLTFEALSGRPVALDLFAPEQESKMAHITMARRCNLLAIVPATANIIGKIANGLADDLLSTLALACACPILLAPAMNSVMYNNPVVQDNLRKIKKLGHTIVEPEEGELACGEEGYGRLASLTTILEEIEALLTEKDLAGETVLVTAGPTQEPIDPVRVLTNPSSGRMGNALAKAARQRGAQVILISGPTVLPAPVGVKLVKARTALEMRAEVLGYLKGATVVIMAAAVSDFRVAERKEEKIKKEYFPQTLTLIENPDILKEVGDQKGDRIVVGFAAETEQVVERAREKVLKKKVDLIVANNVALPDSGFGALTNRVHLIERDLSATELPLLSKEEVAHLVLDRVREIRRRNRGPAMPHQA